MFKLSIDKLGKDQGKANYATAFIGKIPAFATYKQRTS
jgi:hypothetical protein